MTRLLATAAARAAAAKAGLRLEPVEQPKTADEPAPAADDRRIHRHLLSLDLRLRWPGAFTEPPRPLANGSGQALADLLIVPGGEVEFDDLRGVLKWWCNRQDYLAAVARGDARVDLTGKPVSLPSAAERERAGSKARGARAMSGRAFGLRPHQGQGIARRRRQRQITQIHALGPRVVFELIDELDRVHGLGAALDSRLEQYATIDPVALRIAGGDKFPAPPLRRVS